jgi:membrane protease YdiL (CAAX protease family)
VTSRAVRKFLRDEWLALLVFISSVVVTIVAIGVAAQRLHPWWLSVPVILIIVAAELCFLLLPAKNRSWVRSLTVGQWQAIDRETSPPPTGTFDWKVLVILVTAAVSLTIQDYIGDRGFFEDHFKPHGPDDLYYELRYFVWWAGWRIGGYVVLPMIVLLAMRERVRDYHISFQGFFKHLWIYVALFLFVLPLVIAASTTPSFRHTYPFYRLASRSYFDLCAWEALYALQFLSLEFFFRGFLLRGLRRALGSNSIFVMCVPYCMIHYGKPLPETLGAIGAGLILGTLAMRTRSIWGGVLIHVGVASTMDMLALHGCPPIGSGQVCGGA